MGATKLKSQNDTLLEVDYSKPSVMKSLLKNWSGIEAMSLRGDRVATCVLVDLKTVTGMDTDKFNKDYRYHFDRGYEDGVLTYYQFMSIAYTLVLGYPQNDIAFVMGVDQSVIAKNINRGINRICKALTCNDCDFDNDIYSEE